MREKYSLKYSMIKISKIAHHTLIAVVYLSNSKVNYEYSILVTDNWINSWINPK